MEMSAEELSVLAFIAVPSAFVFIIALLKGYHIYIIRPWKDDEHGDD